MLAKSCAPLINKAEEIDPIFIISCGEEMFLRDLSQKCG
jgi:hypothetical protein